MQRKIYFSFFIILVFLFSCKKAEDRRCLKSSGDIVTIRKELPNFSKLELTKNLIYTLIQDSLNYVEVIGGKNLINFVEFELNQDGRLLVSNKNKCNFLRDLDKKIHVKIHFKTLEDLTYSGSELLTNEDTLRLEKLHFVMVDCAGSIKFNINTTFIKGTIADGFGDFTLSGKTTVSNISVKSNGFCDITDLKVTESLFVENSSPNDIKINASQIVLGGFIDGSGDVLYHGEPKAVDVKELSTGKFKPL